MSSVTTEAAERIIGANKQGIVNSPTLLALQGLPVPDEVRARWRPAQVRRYEKMVNFKADADATPRNKLLGGQSTAELRMAMACP